MNNEMLTFEVAAGTDELGGAEELTWDLFPIVSADETSHLDENGLPKAGTILKPGMILVGKIGKTRAYSPELEPTDLEMHGLSFDELQHRFGYLWKDGSERVPPSVYGEVVESKLERREDSKEVAVVRVRVLKKAAKTISTP